MKHFNACSLILTEECNLACKYCYVKQSNKRMDVETAYKAIDFLIEGAKFNGHKEIVVTYFGGEPLLNLDTLEASFDYGLKRCQEEGLGFGCSLITNCTTFPAQYEEFLLKWKRACGKINVQLSVDGPPEIQDTNRVTKRGLGSSSAVERIIRKYIEFAAKYDVKLGEEIHVHSVLSKFSMPRLHEIYQYFERLGFPGMWFLPVHEEDWVDEDLGIFEEQLNKVAEDVINNCTRTGSMDYFQSCVTLSRCYAQHPSKPCAAGYDYCTFTPEGKIYPCHRFYYEDPEGTCLGQLGDSYDEMESSRAFYVDYQSSHMIGEHSCGDCGNYECYRCIAANQLKTGNKLLVPVAYCKMAQVEKRIRTTVQQRLGIKPKDACATTADSDKLEHYIMNLSESLRESLGPLNDMIEQNHREIAELHAKLDSLLDVVNTLANVVIALAEKDNEQ